MIRYTIRINYRTGDSFRTYDAEDDLAITWRDLDKAKDALARIAAFYRAENKGFFDRTGPDTIKTLPGYCEEYPTVAMTFQLDDGSEQRHDTFWRGYFERLERAQIVMLSDNDDGMVFEPS